MGGSLDSVPTKHLDVRIAATRFSRMVTRPSDTSAEAWSVQQKALSRLGPAGRVRVAIELSQAVRDIQIEGALARHPGWDRAMAVRHLIGTQFGVDLSGRP